MSALRELARAAGIDPEYMSWRGQPAVSSDDALLQTLRALERDLGVAIRGHDDAAVAIRELEHARWRELVPPVVLAWDGLLEVPFRVRADADTDWELEVLTEGGARHRARGRMFDLPADSHAWPGGVVHCVRRARLALGELGYHAVRWRAAGGEGDALAIAAPMRAFGPPGSAPPRWGVFAPVYGLASAHSGEAGDLATLRELAHAVARRGGHFVSVLPMLAAQLGYAGQPCAYSPYAPVSRLFWNELYLDLAALCGDAGVAAPAAPPITAGALIDYAAQYAWRRPAIDACASALYRDPARAAAIDAWAGRYDVFDYAAFRAIGEAERASWRHWPAALRDHDRAVTSRDGALALGVDRARLDSHLVAQWAMQHQLGSLGGATLYLDLPVGVSCDAYEVWRWRELFLIDLAAGAPPDALFLGGQDWGLPPLSPIALRRDRYRYFIRCVRHHMRVAGMLRIDHVMGLFRLYCIPAGRPATDGVYLRYHADELLAIVTLESQRARCAVAGEDLGTVPPQVRPAMTAHGLHRLHVGQWFLPARTGDAPGRAPPDSVASLNTHDTPTFAGWWRGLDIDDKLDLGLIDDAQAHAERAERDRMRAALAAFAGAQIGADHLTEVERAMVAATSDLALGPAEIVLVSLDDLALEPVPHNVPGTTTQRPNWRRRVDGWADALDEARAAPAAAAAIAAVIEARRFGG
ncbi:MAG TPA: 4-alpha-glucanotransferase [Kofleriaceae bacterium]|nr:4-alpha-glucanotransferase [Kofleriaceae bacterium]